MPTWRLMLLSLLLCTMWLGCSDDSDPSPDGGTTVDAGTAPADGGPSESDAGTDAGPPDDSVRVRRFTRHRTVSGFEERPEDFTRNPIALFREEGDALVSIPGVAGGPGEFVFPDVPQATYYLKVGTTYVVSDARSLDLSINVLGRADAEPLQYAPMVSLTLWGVENWSVFHEGAPRLEKATSELQFLSEELGIVGDITPGLDEAPYQTVVADVALSIISGRPSRFEEARGDRARVIHLSPRELGALPDGRIQEYSTAVGTLDLPPFSHDGGEAPIVVEGMLQPLPLNREFPLDWKVSAFAAHAAEVNPAARVWSSGFDLYPAAHGLRDGWIGYSGRLLTLGRPYGYSGDAVGTLLHGNPYPPTWGLVAQATTGFAVQVQHPTGGSVRLTAGSTVRDEASRLAAGPIVPRIQPPRGLTLDGTEAYSSRTLSAGAHVLGWQPPASGSADAYVVVVRRRDFINGFPTFVTAATFYLDGSATSVRLPADLFQPNQSSYVYVRAVLAEGYDMADRPLMLTDQLPYHEASALSGLLSVPRPTP